MSEKSKLAVALAGLAGAAGATENRADAVLAIVKRSRIENEKQFSIAIRDAYVENGWNPGAGKPREGNILKPVPPTVKQYVSQVRAAFRFRVDVGSCERFYDLRKALRKVRFRKMQQEIQARPAMAGIRLVSKGEGLTGAIFHDVVVVYASLPETKQQRLAAAVNRLIREYKTPELVDMALAA